MRIISDGQRRIFRIDSNGQAYAIKFNNTSDKRLKTNIYPFVGGLKQIKKMKPVNYTFNGLGNTIEGQEDVGFIAQDIEKIAPHIITKNSGKLHPSDTQETDLLSISPMGFIPILVNAIKELSQKVSTLEQQMKLEISSNI